MKLREDYGLFLTGKRIEHGLTTKRLSEMTGVSIRKIENIEKENKGWSLYDLDRLRKTLNFSLSEVFYD